MFNKYIREKGVIKIIEDYSYHYPRNFHLMCENLWGGRHLIRSQFKKTELIEYSYNNYECYMDILNTWLVLYLNHDGKEKRRKIIKEINDKLEVCKLKYDFFKTSIYVSKELLKIFFKYNMPIPKRSMIDYIDDEFGLPSNFYSGNYEIEIKFIIDSIKNFITYLNDPYTIHKYKERTRIKHQKALQEKGKKILKDKKINREKFVPIERYHRLMKIKNILLNHGTEEEKQNFVFRHHIKMCINDIEYYKKMIGF